MGKLFTTETTDTINVAMTVQPICFDDRYSVEVQSADLKVWNEGTRLFCRIVAEIELVDTEDPRNTAILLLEEGKIAIQSLSKQVTYQNGTGFVTIESINAVNEQVKEDIAEIVLRHLEIEVRIEGI